MENINTITDWIQALAEAAEQGAYHELDRLESISRNWLQSNQEAQAQQNLIAAIRELFDSIVTD